MKYTFCITQQCNLRCSYCYIGKKNSVMSFFTAESIVNDIFNHTPAEEKIDIGFFGGEPLLEFSLIKQIVNYIENHSLFSKDRIELSVVTNGTIFSSEIGEFLGKHNITFCLSCDGPSNVQDKFRHYKDGRGSSKAVEKTIKQALGVFESILVNAVYHPQTLDFLPQVVEYFSSLGIRHIYINPDYSADWTKKDAEKLPVIYNQLAGQYIDFYLRKDPHLISLIDSKIMIILKEGYEPFDRCRMGRGEFAFSPSGNIYPCERLIGFDDGGIHCIGNVATGLSKVSSCGNASNSSIANDECKTCSLADYCMNWCGCSNYFSSGQYDKVSSFLCASEGAAISIATNVLQSMENELGAEFIETFLSMASSNSCKGSL